MTRLRPQVSLPGLAFLFIILQEKSTVTAIRLIGEMCDISRKNVPYDLLFSYLQ